MDQLVSTERYSPYRFFSAEQWAGFRADTPLTLTADEVQRLSSLYDPIDLDEVRRIYLSLSRLLSAHVESSQQLFRQRQQFFNANDAVKTPYIIGMAGSVAVGKSTTARVLKELMGRWPSSPKVDLVTTDGFLFPNRTLKARGLMERKGFPESYDVKRLIKFVGDVKSGVTEVHAPIYSHLRYDIVPDESVVVRQPDIMIIEGLNVLQIGAVPHPIKARVFVSDFFDFSVFVDAKPSVIEKWYVKRFLTLRRTAFANPSSYFHRYASMNDAEAVAKARDIWSRINGPNLRQNIHPTRTRADLILEKGPHHDIARVHLRKL